jgi:adenylosuccinate synthase
MPNNIYDALSPYLLNEPGAYFVVDGQFGSTGKGVIAAALGREFGNRANVVTNNAGPNSGHTHYDRDDNKVVLKQLPSFSASAEEWWGLFTKQITYLNAGAVISPDRLADDADATGIMPIVDPHAAIIRPESVQSDEQTVRSVASTGQGVGPALAAKLSRNREAVMESLPTSPKWHVDRFPIMPNDRVFVEVSQGYSLGINSGFYPYCTSRECSVQQAMSDARIPVSMFRRCILSVRTYPIRVGNTEGSSGPCYDDQHEISWDDIGVEPERTTVTGRVRRVFTWSDRQFQEAVRHNDADIIFVNFLNYLPEERRQPFIDHLMDVYKSTMGFYPVRVIGGFGPKFSDLKVVA